MFGKCDKIMEAITIKQNEEYLRQISKYLDINDPHLLNYIWTLKTYCLFNNVLAMAGIQLGIDKRIVQLKNYSIVKYYGIRTLINPVIIKKEGLTQFWEGCASCPDQIGLVNRPYRVTVQYTDIKGRDFEKEFEGFESTVLSHEIDHLDGILHLDRAKKVLNMNLEERKRFYRKPRYNIITRNGDYNELEEQKVLELRRN